MPAVAVTSAQGAYAYIVALKGFSVGCQPSFTFDQCRNWKKHGISFFGFCISFPTTPNHPFASAEVVLKLGRDLRYKTESTTVICAFFFFKKTSLFWLASSHDGRVQFAPKESHWNVHTKRRTSGTCLRTNPRTPFLRHCLGKLIRTQSIVARSMSAGDLLILV